MNAMLAALPSLPPVPPVNVFAKYENQAWPHKYQCTLHLDSIAGGTPFEENTARGHIASTLRPSDDILMQMVADTMVEMKLSQEEAINVVSDLKYLCGFKRDENGLYIEGRQVKAALREAASISVALGRVDGRKWGTTNKGLKSFFAETVMVVEDRIYFGVHEPTGVAQRFVHTAMHGSSMKVEQYLTDVDITFTVKSAHPFTEQQWAMFWSIGSQQGLGASRSQGYGRYTVTQWDEIR